MLAGTAVSDLEWLARRGLPFGLCAQGWVPTPGGQAHRERERWAVGIRGARGPLGGSGGREGCAVGQPPSPREARPKRVSGSEEEPRFGTAGGVAWWRRSREQAGDRGTLAAALQSDVGAS